MIYQKRILLLFGVSLVLLQPQRSVAAEIHKAAADLDLKRVASVLDQNAAATSATDAESNTPLHVVAKHIFVRTWALSDEQPAALQLIDLLKRHGAKQAAKNLQGFTPLQVALGTGPMSTLHLAATNGYYNTVQALLALGANPNLPLPNNGMQPLLMAAFGGHRAVVQLLLANGADVDAKTKSGSTALGAAREQKHSDVEQALIQHKIALMQKSINDTMKKSSEVHRQADEDLARYSSALRQVMSENEKVVPMSSAQREEVKSRAKSFEAAWLAAHPRRTLKNYPVVVIQDDLDYKKLSRDIQTQIQLDLIPMVFEHPLGLDISLNLFNNFSRQMAAEGCDPRDPCYVKAANALIAKGAKLLFPVMVQYEILRARHEFNTGILTPALQEMIQLARKHAEPRHD